MRRRLKNRGHVGITPDGPRGPADKPPMARLRWPGSGAVIIPVAWSTARMRRLDTWDRLAIPGWFSRGVQCWGAPLHIPADSKDTETLTQLLEDRINAITATADDASATPMTMLKAAMASSRKSAEMIYRLLTSLLRPILPAICAGGHGAARKTRCGSVNAMARPGCRAARPALLAPCRQRGQSVSALVLAASLIKESADEKGNVTILITSGTVTSAAMLAERINEFGGRSSTSMCHLILPPG